MKNILNLALISILIICSVSGIGQTIYTSKISLGSTSLAKWYRVAKIDLTSSNYNSLNVEAKVQYVNSNYRYIASALIRLRKVPTSDNQDWQYTTIGVDGEVLKFVNSTYGIWELWAYSNSNWGHFGSTLTVLNEGPYTVTMSDIPEDVTSVTGYTPVSTNRNWTYHGGNVGIGEMSPTAKLHVDGKIISEEVRVEVVNPPDYVFDKTYNLPTLKETEAFIKQNHHLPEVPSAAEMQEEGLELGKMNMLLLQKIEEMTLHQIELNKLLFEQQKQLEEQNQKISNLENKFK